MGTQTQTVTVAEFNSLQFEKKLTSLKDSQDSINACCQWCLQNRQHHKKIVNAWLNVLKRVKVEQRLILFYLANDVVQYSKRKNYEYVESWGTALQKATTLVRDDRVKHKILRIFKIWEQRGVYNEEFISDLCGLISVVPSAPKGDEPHEFQPNYVINKIKTCSNLEKDTDSKLKVLKEHNPKITIDSELCASLKDRAHVDDVEKEIDVYVKHMEDYINALKLEIKNRIALISVLKQAETQLESDRKDVKLVAHAYKMFGTRVKTFQKKLEEHRVTLSSPVPSPDINAPSPSPDSDIDLPEGDAITRTLIPGPNDVYNPSLQLSNPGYYNPVPPPSTDSNSFLTNGFSTFMGSNMPFNLQNLNSSSLFPTGAQSGSNPPSGVPPPLPVEAPTTTKSSSFYPSSHMAPLLPPPMPPFSGKTESGYGSYSSTPTTQFGATFSNSAPQFSSGFGDGHKAGNSYSLSDDYNPEQDVETWEPDASWLQSQQNDMDTPESPPNFEKESYVEPVEYHDNAQSGAVDVDHRVLPGLGPDLHGEDSLSSLGGKDVDHRNLISLTGSPADSNSNIPPDIWNQTDQDYRTNPGKTSADQDYRLPFNIEQLKLPPPPPPPSKPLAAQSLQSGNGSQPPPPPEKPQSPSYKSPRKFQDNVESIDMDLSDDETESRVSKQNLRVVMDARRQSLEPPPPLPDLPDDVDANTFLDDLSNELNEFSNMSDEMKMWEPPPSLQPPAPPMDMSFPPPLTPLANFTNPGWSGGGGGEDQSWMHSAPQHQEWEGEWTSSPSPEPYRDWSPQQEQNFGGFRGRGAFNRGNFNRNNVRGSRARGGSFNFRGGNNFRGRGGTPRVQRGGPRQKGLKDDD